MENLIWLPTTRFSSLMPLKIPFWQVVTYMPTNVWRFSVRFSLILRKEVVVQKMTSLPSLVPNYRKNCHMCCQCLVLSFGIRFVEIENFVFRIYTALQCTFNVMLLKFSWKRPRFSEKPVLIVDRKYQCKTCIENIALIAQFQYISVGKLGIMLTFSRCQHGRILAILIFSCYIILFTFHSLFPTFIYFFTSF